MVGLSGEERPGLQFGDVSVRGVELVVQVFQKIVLLLDVGFFLSEMNIGFDVAGERREFIVRGNLFFGAFALAGERPVQLLDCSRKRDRRRALRGLSVARGTAGRQR